MSYISIYFGDKPVFLCDVITPEIEGYRHHPDAVFIDEISPAAINSLLHEIDKSQFHAGIIYGEDFCKLKSIFFKHFHIIFAGGGVVFNEKNQILLINRRNIWDLPKGKRDEGETLKECALREVKEETGLQKLELINPVAITYHTYKDYGKHILKETHWYEMKTSVTEKMVPQKEEDISEVKWVEKNELTSYISNTFRSIAQVLQLFQPK